MIFHDIPWYSMIFHDIPWYSMIFHDIPWYSMWSNRIRKFSIPKPWGENTVDAETWLQLALDGLWHVWRHIKVPKIAKTPIRFTRDGSCGWNLGSGAIVLHHDCRSRWTLRPRSLERLENGDCVVWGESVSLNGLVVKNILMNRLI